MAAVMAVGRDFFRLPAVEKAKLYSDDPARKIRLSTSFNVRAYFKEVRELGFRLYAAISENAAYMKQTLGDEEQHVAVNLYPEPELTSGGLPAHTDPDALTILLMGQDVAGLQVLHGGGKQWVTVNPLPGALVISIGDQLRALAKRSRGLSTDAAVFLREPGARPRLGENRAAALGQGVLVDPDGIASVHTLLCYSDGLVLPLESIIAAGEEETFMRSSPDAVLVQVTRRPVPVPVPVVAELQKLICDPKIKSCRFVLWSPWALRPAIPLCWEEREPRRPAKTTGAATDAVAAVTVRTP
jgi:hypothetical protein